MTDISDLLACPDCHCGFTSADKSIKCPSCGKEFPFLGGAVDLLKTPEEPSPGRPGWRHLLSKIGKRLLHPTRNPPFSALKKRQIKELYEECLSSRAAAEYFRRHYLPAAFHKSTGSVFDFGCGRGRHSAMLSLCGFDIIGLDRNYDNYWVRIKNARFIIGTDKDIRFIKDGIFDICLSFLVMQYVKDDTALIRETNRILKKNGYLILSAINKNNLKTRLRKIRLIDEPIERYYSMEDLKSRLEKLGFAVESVRLEKFYFPYFTEFFQFITEVLLPRTVDRFLSDMTPPRYRGIINVIARKI